MTDQTDKLRTLNGELCAEINRQERRIRELEALLDGEIVRCRDCANPSFDEFGGGWCNENCREVKPWDYCAWAKRKEGGE